MSISQNTARKICSGTELELVLASFAPAILALDEASLRSLRSRARRLRDRWRDAATRQRGEARGKRTPRKTRPASDSANTVRKQRLFAETTERIEKQLTRLVDKREREAARKAAQEARAAARAAERERLRALREASRKTPRSAPPAKGVVHPSRTKGVTTRGVALKGQIRATGKRQQARRDGR
jgi:hypothetical protein